MADPNAIAWQNYQANKAPRWLRQGFGEPWLRGIGDAKDEVEVALKDAVKARFPSVCPVDALSRLGGERGIERGPRDTTDAYRARVKGAWDAWEWAGTPTGVLRALYWAGYNATLLTGVGHIHALDGALNEVRTGSSTSPMVTPSGMWNGFRVLLDQSQWGLTTVVVSNPDNYAISPGAALWGWRPGLIKVSGTAMSVQANPGTLTIKISNETGYWLDLLYLFSANYVFDVMNVTGGIPASNSDEANNIRRLVNRWKPATALFEDVVIHQAGEQWGYPSTLKWGDGHVWGGSASVWPAEI
jgi:hypothetical protein